MPKVGILVLYYNDLQHINLLLKSLVDQTYNDFHVYLKDNYYGTNQFNIFINHFSNITLLPVTENIGFAKGNNLLAEKAIKDGCDYVWVLNPDMEPENNALEELVEFMEKTPEAGMSGPLLLIGDTKSHPLIQLFGSEANYRTQAKKALYAGRSLLDVNLPESMETDLANAGSLFVRSEIVKNSYLFEEKYFMYNDEIDLARRVKESGYKIYVISSAKVWHHHNWASTNKTGYNLMYYYMMRNRMLYFRKFSLISEMIMDLLKQVIKWPATLRFAIKTSGLSLFCYYYLGLFHGLLNKQGKAEIDF